MTGKVLGNTGKTISKEPENIKKKLALKIFLI
jgi:hypothetical protein